MENGIAPKNIAALPQRIKRKMLIFQELTYTIFFADSSRERPIYALDCEKPGHYYPVFLLKGPKGILQEYRIESVESIVDLREPTERVTELMQKSFFTFAI